MHVHTLDFFTNVTLILFGIHKNDSIAMRNVYLLFENFRPKLTEMFVWNSITDLPTYGVFGRLPRAVLAQFSVCPFPGLRHCQCGEESCKLRPKFKKKKFMCNTLSNSLKYPRLNVRFIKWFWKYFIYLTGFKMSQMFSLTKYNKILSAVASNHKNLEMTVKITDNTYNIALIKVSAQKMVLVHAHGNYVYQVSLHFSLHFSTRIYSPLKLTLPWGRGAGDINITM